ncbi:MAG: MlaD family protein [Rikenellaceae bacterium]
MKLSREFKVGVFGITMILCLFWVLNFLKGKDVFSSTKSYYAQYENISGVQSSAGIYIKGYKVGTVTDISYNPSKDSAITLKLNIESDYHIPVNSTARLFTDGLMGGKAIEIVYGDADQYLQRGDTLTSMKDKDLLEVAGSEIGFLMERADKLSSEAILALQNINALIASNQQSLQETMNNLSSMSSDLKDVTGSERENIKAIISDISVLTATLNNNAAGIENIVVNLDNLSDSLNHSGIVSSLTSSVNELNTALKSINDQDGTMGKLIGDSALYDSLVTATTNLAILFEDLKENPKRYVNISVFGKKSTSN